MHVYNKINNNGDDNNDYIVVMMVICKVASYILFGNTVYN